MQCQAFTRDLKRDLFKMLSISFFILLNITVRLVPLHASQTTLRKLCCSKIYILYICFPLYTVFTKV